MPLVCSSRSTLVWLIVFTIAAPFSAGAGAAIIQVDDSANGSPLDGSSWCNAFRDLQDTLAAAHSGDEIQVAAGVYTPDRGTGDRLATFRLKSGVIVLGGYAGCGASNPSARDVSVYPSVLSGDLSANDGPGFANYGDNSYHVVTYSDGQAVGVVLDGFTVTAGNADGTGPPGTITNQGSAVHIRNDAFKCIPGGPTLRNCTFHKNMSAHHGAVNDHAFTTAIENCVFSDNLAGQEGAGLVIDSGSATVTNTTFMNNLCNAQGGGAWISHDTDPSCTGDPSRPTFTGCSFIANTALVGGGLFAEKGSSPELRNCTFTNNTATNWGGAVWVTTGSAKLVDCVLDGNTADSYGGGIYANLGASLELERCSLSDNWANFAGGGVYTSDGSIHATDCAFDGNVADVSYGGGVYSLNSAGAFTRCTFRRNDGYFGGGIAHFGDEEFTVTDCVFQENRNGAGGAGFSTLGSPRLTNCLFEGNVGGTGPGVYTETPGAHPVLEGCVFRANIANINESSRGGAMFNRNSNPQVIGCTFSGNAAAYQGGAIFNESATVTLTDCSFTDNHSDGQGGAVVNTRSTVVFSGCSLSGNSSGLGGAGVYSDLASRIRFDRCSLAGDTPSGGATLFQTGSTDVLLTNCVLSDIASCEDGGQLTLVNSIVRSNGRVRGVSLNTASGCRGTLVNTVLTGTSDPSTIAGGITVSGNGPLTLINSTFSANQFGGGVIRLMANTSAAIHNCIFWGDPGGTETSHLLLSSGVTLDIQSSCVQGWTGHLGGVGNFGANPMLVDADGPDGIPGTADDDFRLAFGSPGINAGNPSWLPADFADLDGDGDVNEPLPLDLNLAARVYGTGLDIGALETGPMQCQPGTFSATGAPPCTSCVPGSAQPSTGATQCVECAPGKIAPSAGSATCSACPTGTYQPASAAISCLPCNCDDDDPCTTNACDATTGVCEFPPILGCSIPTVSDWGLTILALLLMIAGTVVTGRPARAYR
jgi:hypothetical protein